MAGLLTEPYVENRRLAAEGLAAFDETAGAYIGALAEEAWVRNPTASFLRAAEREAELDRIKGTERGRRFRQLQAEMQRAPAPEVPTAATDLRLLSAGEANARFGIKGHLAFDAEIPATTAEELYRLKRDELARLDVMRRAQVGVTGELAGFAAGLAVSALDPLNLASAFVPVVGPARYALWLERAGTAGGRAAVRAGVGAAEGAAGAVLLEPLVYGVAKAEQADYGAVDSLLNLAFGTALGGGLHVAGGAVADRLAARRQAKLAAVAAAVEALSPTARERAMRVALADLADGGAVRQADTAIAAERAALVDAYDAVRREPLGPPDDPAVRLSPSELDSVLVERGVAIERDGEVTIPGRGYGLVKVIWRHGEASREGVGRRVTRDDVVDLPRVLREFEPSEVKGEVGEEGFRRAWRVERDGRTVVYATTRWGAEDRLVTVYVEGTARGPFSRPRAGSLDMGGAGPAGSPARIVSPDGDTAPAASVRAPAGRVGPAGQRIDEAPAPAQAPADGRADLAPEDLGVAERLDEAFANAVRVADGDMEAALQAAEGALAEIEGEARRLGALGLVAEDAPELRQVAALDEQAAAEAKGYDAAVSCLIRNGG